MSKRIYIYIGLLLLIIVGLILFESSKPKPVDWHPYYKVSKKTPFGLYVWDNEMERLFAQTEIIRFNGDLYDYLDENYNYIEDEYEIGKTFLYVSKKFNIDDISVSDLLDFAYDGNTVFFAASSFPTSLLNDLEISCYNGEWFADTMQLMLPGNSDEKFELSVWHANNYFRKEADSVYTPVGVKFSNLDVVGYNFIQVSLGSGKVYLHTNPEVFSNYFLLNQRNRSYVEYLSGYLNDNPQLIFYTGENYASENLGDTPLRFILSKRSLKWAWFLLLITGVLFMIFKAKRTQRIIPIKEPNVNTTVQFVRTVADLHYRERDYYGIMEKRIVFFLEKIRNDFRIDTSQINEEFNEKLRHILPADKKDIDALYRIIKKHHTTTSATEYDLIGLNRLLQKMNL